MTERKRNRVSRPGPGPSKPDRIRNPEFPLERLFSRKSKDEIARACRGIRRFCGHTELRVGTGLYVDLTVFAGLGDATFVHPLDLDVHIHHLYGQDSQPCLQYADNMKVKKYGPTCSSQARKFLPLGFTL